MNMKTKIAVWMRAALFLCSASLVVVLFVPLWRIDLTAPQYPEGLYLEIHPAKLGGDVEVINGLNHYIGMKTLHAADFVEFTFLPYIIGFFALLYLLVALTGSRKFLFGLLALFILFGLFAMYDFWHWEYQYGHDLNPNAAIIVPGMAYQPPLIGFKQLLNFGAYSFPDTGGWIFVAVGAITLLLVLLTWKRSSQYRSNKTKLPLILCMLAFGSCKPTVTPIRVGTDACYFCKMTITDERFGAEILTKKGKTYLFDDIHCLQAYLKMNPVPEAEIAGIYLTDFLAPHNLLLLSASSLVKQESIRTPMNGNIVSFSQADSAAFYAQLWKGKTISWNNIQP